MVYHSPSRPHPVSSVYSPTITDVTWMPLIAAAFSHIQAWGESHLTCAISNLVGACVAWPDFSVNQVN